MKIKRGGKAKAARFDPDKEINELKERYAAIPTEDTTSLKRFTDFPLSKKLQLGLQDAKYVNPTKIQRDSIGPALQGRDILGAAITGSGKTLAFLIPVLEHLYTNKWSHMDGVGAIIISPTRELAYQIFETLKKVGKHYDFSAGLIIGGKNLKFERRRMDACNILICTPGRLLQHMDENPLFNATSMRVLVLDEADRCLDMGFEKTLNAIIENFPPDRQTLLFSATQTNSVKDLVRLNLKDPVEIGRSSENTVPELLQQTYVVVPLEEKVTVLWSFIKNHLRQKIIVFLSTCKQVKYVYEVFCKLRPGTSLLALYGTLHQDRRISIYNDFLRKSNVVLFATDIASRGLDFPAVNWVVQLDCPEDVAQYIHRAGRSARNKARGESLLVLTPAEEEGMLSELTGRSIDIKKIHIDPKKLFSPRAKMEGFLAQQPELKATAQRAFLSYIKSVLHMRNKTIFNALKLDFDAYAGSLGLAVTPRVRFLERLLRNANAKPSNEARPSQSAPLLALDASDSEDDDDFIRVKRLDHDVGHGEDDEELEEAPLPIPKREKKLITKASLAKKAIKKKLQVNERVKFDEDGEEVIDVRKRMQSKLAKEYMETDGDGGIDIEAAKRLLTEEDKFDKQRFRELVKQRHRKTKEKLKQREKDESKGGDSSEGDGGGSSDENSVDLSWLPDPKKIYKRGEREQSLQSSEDAEDSEVIEEDASDEPDRKRMKVTSKLTLDDAEVIAAQLLASTS